MTHIKRWKRNNHFVTHYAAKWSSFTEMVVIQHDRFCSFFVPLPTLLRVSEWAKTIATRDSWSSSLKKQKKKNTSIKNKARFWVLVIFSWVWCCLSLSGDVSMLWAMSPVDVLCQASTKTPTVYQDCTSQDHRNHTYSISRTQLCRHSWNPPQPTEGSHSRFIQSDRHMLWGGPACLSDSAETADRDSILFIKGSAHFTSSETT